MPSSSLRRITYSSVDRTDDTPPFWEKPYSCSAWDSTGPSWSLRGVFHSRLLAVFCGTSGRYESGFRGDLSRKPHVPRDIRDSGAFFPG